MVMVIFCVIFHFCTTVKIDVNKVTLTEYSSIAMTDKRRLELNSRKEKILEDTFFTNYWEIPKKEMDNYGNVFELAVHFQLSRYVPLNDYIIGFDVDYSALDASEKIFFSDALGWTEEQYLFQCNGGDDPAPTFVCFTGCTNGKDEQEILDIVKKINITILTQDKLGKIKRKKIDISSVKTNIKEADEDDTESMLELFE